MLLILLLSVAGVFFLRICTPMVFQKKPAIKPDHLKSLMIMLGFVSLVKILVTTFFVFVIAYGFSYRGVTIDEKYAYLALALLVSVFGFAAHSSSSRFKLRSTSLAVVGIDKSHALPTLYDTLGKMDLRYVENVSRLALPDLDMDVEVLLDSHEIRFRTARPIDKIFLRRLCRAFQEQYRLNAFPLPRNYAVFSALKGGLCLAAAAYLLYNGLFVRHWLYW